MLRRCACWSSTTDPALPPWPTVLQGSGATSRATTSSTTSKIIPVCRCASLTIASASVAISIKILSRTEPADAIVLYTTLIWTPLSLLPAVFVWQWPSPLAWLWGAMAGLLGTAAHMCWTRALGAGEASALTPISFVQLPVVALLAWWLFGESVDRYTAIGAGIIFASTVYIAHREAVLTRKVARDIAARQD